MTQDKPTREELRLQKQPFQTFIKPIHDDTLTALRGWTPPTSAYVLLEGTKIRVLPGGEKEVGHGLTVVCVEGRPQRMPYIEQQLRKGSRVIHSGNFPKHNDENEERAARAQLYGRAWDKLEVELKQKVEKPELYAKNEELKREIADLRAQMSEADVFRQKVKDLEAELAAAKAKTRAREEKPATEGRAS